MYSMLAGEGELEDWLSFFTKHSRTYIMPLLASMGFF